jgi:hypothetical protein
MIILSCFAAPMLMQAAGEGKRRISTISIEMHGTACFRGQRA